MRGSYKVVHRASSRGMAVGPTSSLYSRQSSGCLFACLSAWGIFSPLHIPAPNLSISLKGISATSNLQTGVNSFIYRN